MKLAISTAIELYETEDIDMTRKRQQAHLQRLCKYLIQLRKPHVAFCCIRMNSHKKQYIADYKEMNLTRAYVTSFDRLTSGCTQGSSR